MVKRQPPASSDLLSISTEQRNNKAFITFFLMVCLLLGGASLPLDSTQPRSIGEWVLRLIYGFAGFAGAAGLVATRYGSWRWSRMAYMLALAFPIGTLLTIYVHQLRVDYLRHLYGLNTSQRDATD